jgi:hypothetical protein
MKFRTLAIVALAFVLPISAAACSSDSTGDLSVNDMSAQIQKDSKIPKKEADCIAQALKKANFTKSDLQDMSKNTGSGKYKEYISAATKCLGATVPANTGTSTP